MAMTMGIMTEINDMKTMTMNKEALTTIDTNIPGARYYFLSYKFRIGNFISFGNSFTIDRTSSASIRTLEQTLQEQLKVENVCIVTFKELSKEDYYRLRGDNTNSINN